MFWKSSMQRYKFWNTLQHNRKPCHDGGCFFLRFSHFPVHLVVNYSTLLLSHSLSATLLQLSTLLWYVNIHHASFSMLCRLLWCLIPYHFEYQYLNCWSWYVLFIYSQNTLVCFIASCIVCIVFFHWWMLPDRWHTYGSTGGNIDPL